MVDAPLIMLVDPDPAQRSRYSEALSQTAEVHLVTRSADALADLVALRPQAVCLSLQQASDHGLELARALREVPAGEAAVVVVYGSPGGGQRFPEELRQRVRERFRVDHFLPLELAPEDLVAVVWSQLRLRKGVEVPPDAFASARLAPAEVQSARRETPDAGRDDLSELLRREASVPNLVALLTAEVGMSSIELGDEATEEIPWSELLQARANLENIKRALRKPLFPEGGGSSGEPDT